MVSSAIPARRLLFLMPGELTWWVWLVNASLIVLGLVGYPWMFAAATALSLAQAIFFLVREKSLTAFSVQLRIGFTAILLICALPYMGWLYWLPAVGTFAMLIFGYCLLARMLSLLPWNRSEPITIDLLGRTFFSRPLLPPADEDTSSGCAGGVCSIAAQVRPKVES